jgi:hypothetical protein
MLAAVGEGLVEAPAGVEAAHHPGRRFLPKNPGRRPQEQYGAWQQAVARIRTNAR